MWGSGFLRILDSENKIMNNLNPSRKPAARTRSGNFLALLLPAVLIPALLMLVLAGGATASAQVVTNSADSGPGTLRSAITNAASGAVITFDPSLSGATITLASTLTINTNLTIDASALPGGLQINGNGSVTVFNVASTVFLNSLIRTSRLNLGWACVGLPGSPITEVADEMGKNHFGNTTTAATTD
jgi:hypothetical protein